MAATASSSRLAALGRGLDRSLALLAGISFGSQFIVATMLPVLPLFAQGLGATPRMLALMVAISAVASAGGQLVGGFLSDRVGARRLLPAGLVGYGAASLLTSVASSAASGSTSARSSTAPGWRSGTVSSRRRLRLAW